jgi:hypothetical protein
MGGAFGVALIMIFFLMPETAFVRTGTVNLDTGSNNVSQEGYTVDLIADYTIGHDRNQSYAQDGYRAPRRREERFRRDRHT